jgi:hypothetical protein
VKVRVVLEVAPKRSFASALDWPGWSRGGKTADEALEALLRYGPRYATVARRARVAFTSPATLRGLEVVERLRGGGGTEFGVPGAAAASEDDPLRTRDLTRLLRLLRAAWSTFDAAATRAEGVKLTLGPRGGGRQVPKIVEHVREAEVAYLAQLGSKGPAAIRGKARSMAPLRRAFTEALEARARGEPLANPRNTRSPWSPRYAVRRSAWHALDHAWEIEDRSA